MKNILGFSISEAPKAEAPEVLPKEERGPVRSLVTVRFPGVGLALTYYNDRFALEVGDHVFVSGKYAGQLGKVEKVETRFRIRLSDYQRVLARVCPAIRGSYAAVLDRMVSFDADAVSPAEFRSWIFPPAREEDGSGAEPEDELVVGDGCELDVFDLERCDEITEALAERALDYCRSGRVAYLAVRDGIGTAFVEGTKWYEVNFRLNGSTLREAYCDCPCPGLCKHLIAVALTLCALAQLGQLDLSRGFVAFDSARFWSIVSQTAERVTL